MKEATERQKKTRARNWTLARLYGARAALQVAMGLVSQHSFGQARRDELSKGLESLIDAVKRVRY